MSPSSGRAWAAEPDSLVALITQGGRRPRALWFPLINLFWLVWMVAAPWLFPAPRTLVATVTCASVALFLWLYQRAWYGPRARLVVHTVAIALLGLAIVPVNSSWSYVIYAGALIPFCTRGWRTAAWVGALLAAFCAVALASGFFTPAATLGCIAMTSIVASLNAVVRHNNERDSELRLTQDEVRRLAIRAERERIGRDLHDLLGHTLSLVAIKSELARRLVECDPAKARDEMAEIERVARQALNEVREAVSGMRAVMLAGELAAARLMLEAGSLRFAYAGTPAALASDAEAALAMGLREAVTNVHRHARATRVDVELHASATNAVLTVRDDGRGGVVAHGNGLTGMAERLAVVGGRLEIESEPGRGTLLRMTVPNLPKGPT